MISPRTDLITAAVFLAFGLAIIAACLHMPTFTDQGTPIYVAPGLVPGFHGLMLCILAIILAARSLARGLATKLPAGETVSLRRTLIAVVLAAAFDLILVGLLPFWLAAALFIFVFITVFEWPITKGALLSAAGIGLLAGTAISLLFQKIFLIAMP